MSLARRCNKPTSLWPPLFSVSPKYSPRSVPALKSNGIAGTASPLRTFASRCKDTAPSSAACSPSSRTGTILLHNQKGHPVGGLCLVQHRCLELIHVLQELGVVAALFHLADQQFHGFNRRQRV